MAYFFTTVSLFFACGEDLFEKKAVSSRTEEVLKTLVWYGIYNFITFCAVLFFGLEDNSLLPHELIIQEPTVVLVPALSFATLVFALAAYKYVGVSVRNSFANLDGLFYILLLVLFYLVTGKASFATRLFSPYAIIGIVLIIAATIIYPQIKTHHEDDEEGEHNEKKRRSVLVLGITLAILSALMDGSESMVSSYLIGDELVDSMEFIALATLLQGSIAFFIWIGLSVKEKKIYNPFRKIEKNRCISQLFAMLADLFYVFALSDDALLSVILWNLFPILDILGARIFMKEKLTRYQYMVLFMLITGALFVSLV